MSLSKNILFKNFNTKKNNHKILENLKDLIKNQNIIIKSLSKLYQNSYKKNKLTKYKRFLNINLIGMGGSILGAKSIYSFLNHKIKKNFNFIDNLNFKEKKIQKKSLNLIISKSGNTLETIANTNIILKKSKNNIFITENKDSYLTQLAKKLKSEIIHHNDYIGGRYSVLSEVGMLPAELMGFKQSKFKRFNHLVKNKKFVNSLVNNVSSIIEFIKKKKSNSIILNYDEKSHDLFLWYQQLVSESLGKKGKGILPVISNMPQDNHSLMQLFLDGKQNNFFTFFFVEDSISPKINNREIFKSHSYLKNKKLIDILRSQFKATEIVFRKNDIPFRSFYIREKKRNEETLGELFTFFILETILLGKALKVNPYDQPAVELVKIDTKKKLLSF